MVTRVVIRFVALSLCVCYLMIWVVTHTKVYEDRWWPVIIKKTSTLYFQIQGTSILIHTVLVLLIAVLGCIYLHLSANLDPSDHLQQQDRRNSFNKYVLRWWKRLCLVKGPLGIVSRTEMVFLAMFIILLVFTFLNFVYGGTTSNILISHKNTKRPLVLLDSAALWAALIGNICLAFMFYPVTRGSSILPLLGLSSESSIRYHKLLGNIAMTLFTAHGALYIVYWALTSNLRQMLRWEQRGISYLAGVFTLVVGLVMWVMTFSKIRRTKFELFYYTHHLYIIFIVFFMLHTRLYDVFMMLPGFYLFVIDRYLRFLQSQQNVKLVSARLLPCEFVELNFAKSPGLKYPATSSIFVNVPSISKLQWHPFTVCSNSDLEPDTISVLIKSQGSWSQKLYQIISAHDPSVEHLLLDQSCAAEENLMQKDRYNHIGPYGPPSTHFSSHETLVMISGGSGITPFISIIRGLLHSASSGRTPRIILISAFKCSSELTVLDLIIPLSASSSASTLISNLDIQIEAYVTREEQPSTSSNVISTIQFKPNSSDAPISSTLGPKSWLWLAVIISASFVISMVIIALVTRFLLHPLEKNPKRVYTRSLKTIVYILVFCASIVASASAAFVLNKRRYKAKECTQMEDNVVPSVIDLEMESLPRKSIAQVTNVHYGSRPDLRDVLDKYGGGSSIGVMVCGPKEMQRDVASVCSSSSMENVEFESISFSW